MNLEGTLFDFNTTLFCAVNLCESHYLPADEHLERVTAAQICTSRPHNFDFLSFRFYVLCFLCLAVFDLAN